MPVTSRIIPFLVGNLHKPLFATGILGGGGRSIVSSCIFPLDFVVSFGVSRVNLDVEGRRILKISWGVYQGEISSQQCGVYGRGGVRNPTDWN